MGLTTVKRKLLAELSLPLDSRITIELLRGLDRGGIDNCSWNSVTHKHEEKYEADYKRYYVNARVHATELGGLGSVLVVDIYNFDLIEILSEKPQYRLLLTETEFVTLEYNKEGKDIVEYFRDSMLNKLLSGVYFGYYHGISCDTSRMLIGAEESKVINEYLCSYSTDPIDAIYRHQEQIRKRQLEARYKNIQERIDMDMAVLPPPLSEKTLKSWADNHVFLENRYIVYTRKGKKIMGECSHCHAQVQLSKVQHDTFGICPNCKSRVQYKSQGLVSTGMIHIEKKFSVVQSLKGGGLVIRIYVTRKMFTENYMHGNISFSEQVRVIEHGGRFRYYYYDYFRNSNEIRWCDSYKRNAATYDDLTSYVYTANLKRALNNTRYKYCALFEYGKAGQTIEVDKYLERYIIHPQIEYLVKLKLYKLAEYLVRYAYSKNDLQGNNIAEVLGVGKSYIPLLQELNVDNSELQIIRAAINAGLQITRDDILFVRQHVDYYNHNKVKNIAERVKLSGALRYCMNIATKKHEEEKEENNVCGCHHGYRRNYEKLADCLNGVLCDYDDYTRECVELELELKDKQIAFPRDLYEAHARTSAQVKARASKIEQRKIADVAAKFAKYNIVMDGLMISVAKTAEEIIHEGKILSHCVGGYVTHVVNGRSVIFFLRKTDEPDTPYYTVELDPHDMRVIQYRGYKNNNANNPVPDEIHEFIEKWKKAILSKSIKKLKRAV